MSGTTEAIVFAVTRRHAETRAEMLDERFADRKPHSATRYANFVVSDVGGGPAPDAGAIVKRFKDEDYPKILVSARRASVTASMGQEDRGVNG